MGGGGGGGGSRAVGPSLMEELVEHGRQVRGGGRGEGTGVYRLREGRGAGVCST